jgi:hypothetical protein
MKKSQLIDLLPERIVRRETMERLLKITTDEEFAFLESAASVDDLSMSSKDAAKTRYQMFADLCWITIFYWRHKVFFVMPREVKEVFAALCAGSLPGIRQHYCMIDRYAYAASRLYGAIRAEELVDLYNEQNDDKTYENEIYDITGEFLSGGRNRYDFHCEYIIHGRVGEYTVVLYEDDECIEMENELIDRLDEAHSQTGLKRLEKETFLKYDDPEFFDAMEAHERMAELLVAHTRHAAESPELLSIFLGDINDACAMNDDMTAIVEEIRQKLMNDELTAMETFLNILSEVNDNTRKWSAGGWTLAELRETGGKLR